MVSADPIIDCWLQHPTGKFLRHEMFGAIRRWIGLKTVPETIPLQMTLSALDAAGVTTGLISAWVGPDAELISNDEVARLVSAAPDRLLGVASVDIRRPIMAIAELRRCVNQLGFRALRLLPWWWGLPPDHRRYYPLYATCVELGIPVCLQVGHTGPLRPSEPGRPIPYLDRVALDFPELTLVGGHIGFPWTNEMIALATKYANVYIDTSAYKPSRFPPELVQYMNGHGRKKVLFGSNYPMITPADALDQLDLLGLDAATTRLFLHDNAARVFGLTDAA